MRMRRKKNLEARLSVVSDWIVQSRCEDRHFQTAAEKKEYLDFAGWFGADRPLFLEIGCGKGDFAVEFARRNPDQNLLAVEKNANVLVTACEKAKAAGLSNLRFLWGGAEYLERYIRQGTVRGIFLNFSCPFPKNSQASHRLTHPFFLQIYKRLLAPGAELHQKTDNARFFEYSLEQLTGAGFALKNISLDMHASAFTENIETEYERKFAARGLPIYRLEAYLHD